MEFPISSLEEKISLKYLSSSSLLFSISYGLSFVIPNIFLFGNSGLSYYHHLQEPDLAFLEGLMEVPEVTVPVLEDPLLLGVQISEWGQKYLSLT